MIVKLLVRNKHVILYGISLALLVFLLKWLELRFIIINHAFEIYIGAIAIIFTSLGIWLASKLLKPAIQTVFVEKEIYINKSAAFVMNEKELHAFGLSKRELEVLQLIAEGLKQPGNCFPFICLVKHHKNPLFKAF